ncbi:7-carboxy-7-deazaguanine synthase [bioreactor metagenome]|uniref:7-carboxy-7-deazaguanine synthase n=1 Tax=bioreactor metagenome TaxID=1076179 RepID=A0A645DY56_9ZZZZ
MRGARNLHLRRKLLDGVVITGGEPLIHEDIIDQIRRIKDLGLAVKLDTNGLFPDKLQMLIDQRLIDHVALDFKHERSAWLKTVGMLQETQRLEQWYPLWERSLLFLQQESITYELRTTVVRQLHSSDGLLAMAKYLVSQRLDLSKVHWYLQSFRYHYPLLCDQQPDANYPKLSAYDPAEMRMIQARLQQYIPNVILREI